MYKSLATCAAATMLAAFAATGPTAAAEQGQLAGVNQQQNAEEFTSQRRRWRRGRVVVRSWGPGYWGPYPYAYAHPYGYPYGYAYAYPYPRRFYGPGFSVGFGPFGFHAW
jgi:hypothetical protein